MEQTPEADPDRGGWIETYSGRKFHLFDPRPEDVDFKDIAHALSLINRYTGHTREPFSVGMHVLLVADMARKYAPEGKADRYEALGLLHDFEEAYTGDIHTPLKRVIFGQPPMAEWWNEFLHRLNTTIYGAANVAMPSEYEERIIKFFDLKSFMMESYWCLPHHGKTHSGQTSIILKEMSKENDRLPPYHMPHPDPDYGILRHWYLHGAAEIKTEILRRLARLTPEGG